MDTTQNDVIDFNGCTYKFEEIRGKGRCLVPLSQRLITELHIGGLYKLYDSATVILIGCVVKNNYSMLPVIDEQVEFRSLDDFTSLTSDQILDKLNKPYKLCSGKITTIGKYLGQYE